MYVPDFDDIIFEKLNKEYGAYFLRKGYNRSVIAAIVIACILGSMVVLTPYLIRPEQKKQEIYTARYVSMDRLMAPSGQPGAPSIPVQPPAYHAKAPARLRASEIRYVAPKVVDSMPQVEKSIAITSDSIAGISDKGAIDGTGDDNGSYSGNGTGTGGGGGGNGLFSEAEVMPKFKGGDINKFREWVQKKTKYPEIATINGIQGRVYVTFIVERDGTVTNGKVVKGVDPLINDEALKAVMSSPKWTPGRQRGEPVRVSYIIMLNFQL
jgi:periplasmic protein TonB